MASINHQLIFQFLLYSLLVLSSHALDESVVLANSSSRRVNNAESSEPQLATTTLIIQDPPEARQEEEAQVASRATTVKKELAPTTEAPTTGAPAGPEVETSSSRSTATAAASRQDQDSPGSPGLESLIPNSRAGELGSMSPELSRTLSEALAQAPANVYSRDESAAAAAPAQSQASAVESIESLLPKGTSLFQQDSIDPTQLGQMDCHLRNIDYCVAGMLGTAQKLLPESEPELEARCDEMKVTTSCMAIYNKRCSTFKIFSLLAPFSQAPQELRQSQLLTEAQRDLLAQAQSSVSVPAELLPSSGKLNGNKPAELGDLMELCQPEAKGSAANTDLRKRLFALAKCINGRVPKLTPCLDDLKTAVQVFYEPRRVLPMQPTCCALARFRACAMNAVDNICGLSSFEQLVQSMGGGGGGGAGAGGPMGMLKTIDRVCRQATDYKSAYCREVLPPSGMKAPARRGNKASKLAKALDLISFAPATQDLGGGGGGGM